MAAFASSIATADTLETSNYLIATVNPIASAAGQAVFHEGGNAVDAAVAAALTLSVVDGHNSGLGGGCLILIRTADGRLVAIDGREEAPAAATRDMFLIDGRPDPSASQTGPLAVGVPGALAAYDVAIEQCGSKPLGRLLQPGLAAARDGFQVDPVMAAALAEEAEQLRRFDGSRAVYFKNDGQVLEAGDWLIQPDLAHTFEQIQSQGVPWFYAGEFAEQVGTWMRENGGLVTAEDFARYRAKLREPIVSTYREHTIVGFPPPSSGGVHVAQALNMLEQYELAKLHRQSPGQAAHVMLEVFSRVFADRAHWLGDSDHARVPRGLIDTAYARRLAADIELDRAVPVAGHGDPPRWRQDVFGRHTTHIAAADVHGNWVAITATVNTSFGSKVIVPGTGVVLNNEMDDFSIQPGVPNVFGLVGAENNAVAPGKRPLSSMSPTIVLDPSGEPALTLGAAGGPKIITQVVLGIVRLLDFKEPLHEAIAGPRFHHQWRPNVVGVEEGLSQSVVEDLRRRGHEVEYLDSGGRTQAIARSPQGTLIGVADPRIPGKVAGD